MMSQLTLLNFPAGTSLPAMLSKEFFVLTTCQRTLVLGIHPHALFLSDLDFSKADICVGEKAYAYWLNVICGLMSELQGESEIQGQCKEAYLAYIQGPSRHPHLQRILEKSFKDAKDIRTRYLMGVSQKTYAAIARTFVLSRSHSDSVLIFGTGQLATDLINQFRRHRRVWVCGRRAEALSLLSKECGTETWPWDQRHELQRFPHIVNTIGTHDILFDEPLIEEWATLTGEHRLWIDLGSPSPLSTSRSTSDGIIRLHDIFSEGEIRDQEKCEKLFRAKEAAQELARARVEYFHDAH